MGGNEMFCLILYIYIITHEMFIIMQMYIDIVICLMNINDEHIPVNPMY